MRSVGERERENGSMSSLQREGEGERERKRDVPTLLKKQNKMNILSVASKRKFKEIQKEEIMENNKKRRKSGAKAGPLVERERAAREFACGS